MITIIKTIFDYGARVFAFGFLAPLIAQIIVRVGWTPPFGLSALASGLILAGLYGCFAQVRGRWI